MKNALNFEIVKLTTEISALGIKMHMFGLWFAWGISNERNKEDFWEKCAFVSPVAENSNLGSLIGG